MKKLKARYFYSPVCPESFRTLERLKILFKNYDQIKFEYFNVEKYNFKTNLYWFPEERKVMDTLEGEGNKPLFFGKLFLEGEEIRGFPPSPKSFKEVLSKYNINWEPKLYSFNYKLVERNNWTCKDEDFKYFSYQEKMSMDICHICTKYHPYLKEGNYNKKDWIKHEKQKLNFLQNKLKEDNLIGIIAYYKNEPVGFVEAFPLNIAVKLGYPVSNVVDHRLMITCLTVRTEVSGNGIGSNLIKELEKEAVSNNYKSLEVISFPDKNNWHPKSLYSKNGFYEIKKISELSVLQKAGMRR